MTVAGAGAHAPDAAQNNIGQTSAAPDAETQRLNQAVNDRLRSQIEANQRLEAANREARARVDAENARRQSEYQAELRRIEAANAAERARYDAEMARFRAEQAENAQRSARRGARSGGERRTETARGAQATAAASTPTASGSGRTCAQQVQRARGRGRAIGGVVGGVAGIVGGRNLGNVARVGVAALSAPVGALIGEAIASRLDCREQEQAARATEQAVEGGVGTSVAWQSETRPGVTGTTTVTAVQALPATPATAPATRATAPAAAAAPAAAPATASVETSPCLTVTDVIIVDGEETRASKTMCRRPPSNRFVRV